MTSDYDNYLKTAMQAAESAAQLIRERFDQGLTVTTKQQYDELVTDLDHQSEKVILDYLIARYPGCNVVSEEQGVIDNQSPLTWVVDPLDGTSNLVLGLPLIGVSIALVDHGQIVVGVVAHAMRTLLYTGVSGQGATVNGHQIQISQQSDINRATIGHVVSFEEKRKSRALNLLTDLRGTCRRVLDTWAPSLEWSLLAQGKLDALVSLGSGQYDRLAGMLLVQEAGGLITDFDGNTVAISSASAFILASNNTRLHATLLAIIRKNYT